MALSPSSAIQPTLFISHGGGPWPHVQGLREQYAKTEAALRRLPSQLPSRPRAVLVITGHWEAPAFTVATAARPAMDYDYYGFPEHTYHLQYPAPGAPDVAVRARSLLVQAGMPCGEDPRRGLDHGSFVPLQLMYPEADMPVTLLSLKAGYDPAEHLRAGAALAPLRSEGVLILGSGLSYHNMRGFGRADAAPVADAFEAYLNHAITQANPQQRERLLLQWDSAPSARQAHPSEDHLMPLLVAAGAAGDDVGRRLFVDHVMHVTMASYVFGNLVS